MSGTNLALLSPRERFAEAQRRAREPGSVVLREFAARRHAERRRTGARRFEGAVYNRLTAGWLGAAKSINTELRGDLDALRSRARDLAKNEPLAARFLEMVVTNVVGPDGFRFQATSLGGNGLPDKLDNDAIERAWADWCQPSNCDATGMLGFPDLCRGIIRAVARDGEALVYVVDGADNPYGIALQWLDIERLATELNREAATGQNAIIMGVELDGQGRRVAYWLRNNPIGSDPTARKAQRYPASQIIHLFMTDDPEQVRGIPWMHASMIRIHHLKGFQEAAIIAARVGASKMGFFVDPEGNAKGTTPLDTEADGEDEGGMPFTEVDPGQFGMLPSGYDFKAFDPDYPHAYYEPFVKAAKRDIGSGFGAAYHSLGNDLEGVNFSSIRSGTLEERDNWMLIQRWLVGALLDRIHERWLDSALLKQAITLPSGAALPASRRKKFMAHTFQGRRWSWVDPLKDIMASVLAIKNRLADPYTIAAQQGVDAEEVLDAVARWEAAAKAKNVTLYLDDTAAMQAAGQASAEPAAAPSAPAKGGA